jgi:hypothetical protein
LIRKSIKSINLIRRRRRKVGSIKRKILNIVRKIMKEMMVMVMIRMMIVIMINVLITSEKRISENEI